MRLILLLVVVLILGVLAVRQLGGGDNGKVQVATQAESTDAPQVPTNARDVKRFETQMNDFVLDNAAQRARQIEEVQGQ
jgi:hypothetical protein